MRTLLKTHNSFTTDPPRRATASHRPLEPTRRRLRRLVVFSDPGGAKPCLSLARTWQDGDHVLVCSDRTYAFFDNFGVPVRAVGAADAPAIVDEFRPDVLFTGTSYTSRIETAFLSEAAKRGIHSTAFVDHYTGFTARFGSGPSRILPDEIHVLDERARTFAAEAGLPPDIIRVTGNPYHDFLRCWRSCLTKNQVFQRLGIRPTGAKIILFAPDPLSNAGGADVFGTDEAAVSRLLLACLGEAGRPFQVLVKAHPNQPLDSLASALRDVPPNVDLHLVPPTSDALLNDLIQHVDLVAGMISSLLSEAAVMGAATLSICIGFNDSSITVGKPADTVTRLTDLRTRIMNL